MNSNLRSRNLKHEYQARCLTIQVSSNKNFRTKQNKKNSLPQQTFVCPHLPQKKNHGEGSKNLDFGSLVKQRDFLQKNFCGQNTVFFTTKIFDPVTLKQCFLKILDPSPKKFLSTKLVSSWGVCSCLQYSTFIQYSSYILGICQKHHTFLRNKQARPQKFFSCQKVSKVV